MFHLITTIQLFFMRLGEPAPERDERGSITIEQVAWATATLTIVAIAVAAIIRYVQTQVGQL